MREVAGSIPAPPIFSPPSLKKFLLVSAAPDSGHAQAARAIAEVLEEELGWKTVVENIVHYFPRAGSLFVKLYKWLVTHHPAFWDHLQSNTIYAKAMKQPEEWLYRNDFFRTGDILQKHCPDVLMATHALPLRSLAAFKRKEGLNIPLFAMVTDFRAHHYWVYQGVDFYFVPTALARSDLIRHGIASQNIAVVGMPLRTAFHIKVSKANARQALRLPMGRNVVMVTGGSYGIFPFEVFDLALRDHRARLWSWIFVFGKNLKALHRAQDRLRKEPRHDRERIRLFGFTEEIPLMMGASDVLVTRGGALSASEASSMGLPMVVFHFVAGQEEKNASYLAQQKVALRAHHPAGIVNFTADLLSAPRKLQEMRERCLRLDIADAREQIKVILKNSLAG